MLVNFTPVQNFIVRKATSILSKKLNTTVKIEHVRLDLLNHINIEGIYIEDQNKDTLLYAGQVQGRITDWFFFKNGIPVIKYVGLKNAYANLYRTKDSEEWNYQFVADAFSSDKKPDTTKKKKNDFNIDLREVDIEQVRFSMNDAWVGSDMGFVVGSFSIDAKNVDLQKHIININKIAATGTQVTIRDYEGGRPPKPKQEVVEPKPIDTTAFNPQNWVIKVSNLSLEECLFALDAAERAPLANEFDPSHMNITNINIDANDINIIGDTLKAKLNNLSAKERCGIEIQQFTSDLTISPNASICENLTLKTANSVIQHHYAMYYTRFPDFNDFLNKITLDAKLDNTTVASKDIAYFATTLRQYPTTVNISGDVNGSIEDFTCKGLKIYDGINVVSGDLSIKGLPDINKTYFDYKNGYIYTNNKGIHKYVPELNDSFAVAIDSIKTFEFKGSYVGYINSFALNGNINSNLGTIVSDVQIKQPLKGNNNTAYEGSMTVTDLRIGTLLKQPLLGSVTMNADVNGTSLNMEEADIKFKALVDYIDINGYRYNNIDADGQLAQKKFTGNLLVNDSNMALGFYGEFDFSQKLYKVNATANLLNSNLTALNFFNTEDTVKAIADFDLNCTGSSIDNFSGYAKLYNIDIRRNEQRLDLDSVYVLAEEEGATNIMTIKSNALDAQFKGQYHLTKLAPSVQYYISGYLPDYIKKPSKDAPDQNLEFELETKELDNIFAVLLPQVGGFNHTTISGALNTRQQSLTIKGNIDEGIIGNNKLRNVVITGNGNFQKLNVIVDAGEVVLGDSAISGNLNLNTTLGNNQLDFTIATSSPYSIGTANLTGHAVAQNDTLTLALGQSEFYLNDAKWELQAGNKTILTDNYISIDGLRLSSGLQELTVNTRQDNNHQIIAANISNLDVAQLGNLAGMGEFEPDGRINGTLRVEDPLGDLYAAADIKGSNIKFGNDTMGRINIVGSYDSKKNLLSLDNKTGIFYGDSHLSAYGLISLNNTTNQSVDGGIEFHNTPVPWAAPFLKGFISEMSGKLNGKVQIKGTSTEPQIIGDIKVQQTAMRIDLLGSYYKIPNAAVHLNNKEISLGKIKLIDRYDNEAELTGTIYHDLFKDMRLAISMQSPKLEVINLTESEGDAFYGKFIASIGRMSINGPIDDISINMSKVSPAAKSHLYLPLTSGTGLSNYNYISFKSYGKEQDYTKKNASKLSIHIETILNPMGEVTMVMDPSTGDAITAKGSGNVSIDMPSSSEFRMFGNYIIEEGAYTFTLKQLFLKRRFTLDKGSVISFTGPIDNTGLNVEGVYTTRARLYDMLGKNEKESLETASQAEVNAAKLMQDINVLLYMKGTLAEPELDFQIQRASTSGGTSPIVDASLRYVNQNQKELLNQVASLLLLNTFTPRGAGFQSTAASGALNNISDVLSGTASSQLTNVISRLTGAEDLAVNVKYQNINNSTSTNTAGANRNEFSIGITKNYFDDRLNVELGSSLDWGRPTSQDDANNFNLVGDFRIQYLIREGGNLRANIFRASNYDVVIGRNINRGGFGLSWRKSFDSLEELIRGSKYMRRKEEEERKEQQKQ